MSTLEFCKRCLYSTAHPLGLILDQAGICSGCRIHEEKDQLNWEERWEQLVQLVGPYRNKAGNNYDCIIPVTGAQDSYYLVYLVKQRLGLNPLLVTYNKYFNTPLGIRNLANLRIRMNCDIVYQNINPLSVKNIVRSTLRRFGSIYWPILAGQTVFPCSDSGSLPGSFDYLGRTPGLGTGGDVFAYPSSGNESQIPQRPRFNGV
jgi:hypothetical protein